MFLKDFIYLLLERGEGKEKEVEKHWLVASRLPPVLYLTGLATQACAPTGIEPVTFWFAGWRPTNWATPVKAVSKIYLYNTSSRKLWIDLFFLNSRRGMPSLSFIQKLYWKLVASRALCQVLNGSGVLKTESPALSVLCNPGFSKCLL